MTNYLNVWADGYGRWYARVLSDDYGTKVYGEKSGYSAYTAAFDLIATEVEDRLDFSHREFEIELAPDYYQQYGFTITYREKFNDE